MSHSDNENKELPDDNSGENADSGNNEKESPASKPPTPLTSLPPVVSRGPAPSAPSSDPRLSRLAKMQSRYVTEEAIRSTEESAKPKEPEPPEDLEFYDDEGEYLEDEEFYDDEEEFLDDEEFEDDDYEDDPHPASTSPPPDTTPEAASEQPEPEPEPEPDDGDHRLGALRKFNRQFVSEKDLEIKEKPEEDPETYREVEIAKVVCPNCQSEEARTQKMCGKCGARLPNITAIEEEKYNPGTMNAAVMKYVNAVKCLQDESWSVDDFEDFLLQREALSYEHIKELVILVEESGSSEWMPEATGLLKDAVDVLADAIAAMISKVETIRDQQPMLEEEYEAHLAEYEAMLDEDEEYDEEPPMAPLSLEERLRMVNFQPDLDEIKRSNNMLLKTLKEIDKFQKKAHEDLEVSM